MAKLFVGKDIVRENKKYANMKRAAISSGSLIKHKFYGVPYGCQASAFSTATAQATEAPTIGLLPIPIRPIISTCAGTEEEPAN